jgi:hypothetical protein
MASKDAGAAEIVRDPDPGRVGIPLKSGEKAQRSIENH